MLCLRLLEERLQISNIRVGGPSDNGIDLIGKWNQNTNILVQCKHINRKLQPSTIRELEGVLSSTISPLTAEKSSFTHDHFPHNHHSQQQQPPQEIIGLLATSTDWTLQSIKRLYSSPLFLLGMTVDVEREIIKNIFINRKLQSRPDLLHFQVGKRLDAADEECVITLTPIKPSTKN